MWNNLVLFAQIPGGGEWLDTNKWMLIGGGVILLVGIFFLVIFISFLRLWMQCFLTGAKISIWDLIGMKLPNVDYGMIVRQKISLVQAGVKVSTQAMEVAEAAVPLALAYAFRSGHLGVMDYFNMRNAIPGTDKASGTAPAINAARNDRAAFPGPP